MGLDWHSSVALTEQERADYIRHYYKDELDAGADLDELVRSHAPNFGPPCSTVGAPHLKDLPGFKERVRRNLEMRQDQARTEQSVTGNHRSQSFVDYWLGMTFERLKAIDGEKFTCDTCPLLRDLNGADSQDSCFLGICVSSCDFRGKRISADDELPKSLRNEAFEQHTPEQMLDYANRLEKELGRQRRGGKLIKASYEQYVREFQQDAFAKALGDVMLTEAAYDKEPHWREQNIREAVHWLRSCAGHGISMETSF